MSRSALCVVCGKEAARDPWTLVPPPSIDTAQEVHLCESHVRPLNAILAAARGDDAAAHGFSHVMQARITTLGDLTYRKAMGQV